MSHVLRRLYIKCLESEVRQHLYSKSHTHTSYDGKCTQPTVQFDTRVLGSGHRFFFVDLVDRLNSLEQLQQVLATYIHTPVSPLKCKAANDLTLLAPPVKKAAHTWDTVPETKPPSVANDTPTQPSPLLPLKRKAGHEVDELPTPPKKKIASAAHVSDILSCS
ncbi:hypothetical protein PAXINDRAFT_19255 [Paxillus involutus ATCC 200175]|uniref:Uncharacterized protein n=1 Tax=Paxillus involutus ATCC 200175 TaxID=664439 RepID=A0A0C9TJR1_PAXIN|nr:hypothetical protein PAXINDRAFT_19255 [Paxillus involutus ATCC 200175]